MVPIATEANTKVSCLTPFMNECCRPRLDPTSRTKCTCSPLRNLSIVIRSKIPPKFLRCTRLSRQPDPLSRLMSNHFPISRMSRKSSRSQERSSKNLFRKNTRSALPNTRRQSQRRWISLISSKWGILSVSPNFQLKSLPICAEMKKATNFNPTIYQKSSCQLRSRILRERSLSSGLSMFIVSSALCLRPFMSLCS